MTASPLAEDRGQGGKMGAARWLAMVISVVGVVASVVALVLIWTSSAGPVRQLPMRIYESTSMAACLLVLGTTVFIAWRAGDQRPNVVLALALTFAFSNDVFQLLCQRMQLNGLFCTALDVCTFILGAGFYIRAAQCFPRELDPRDIESSETIWGRCRPLRALLTLFLHAPAVWLLVTAGALLTMVIPGEGIAEVNRLTVVLVGLVYIYLMYRTSDTGSRRKVLWFLEIALATLFIGVLVQGVHAVLRGAGTQTLRLVVTVTLVSTNYLIEVVCICSAVFYTGAISPVLVIRKTFVYGATVALLLFTYATVEAFVVNVLVEKLGVSDHFAGAFLGTALALAFHPIKNRMEHALRRLQPQERESLAIGGA